MIRKMGIHYSRIDIDAQHSHSDGAAVPLSVLSILLRHLLEQVQSNSSCVLSQVVHDPYLEDDA
jgi:hypothetical protein